MTVVEAVLLGISMCADSFAVSLCSSITIDMIQVRRRAWKVALAFAIIQTSFMLGGWAAGWFLSSAVLTHFAVLEKGAGVIGFILLLFVGGSMIREALSDKEEHLNLGSLRNIVIGGIATSIDALVVGISFALGGDKFSGMVMPSVSVFIFTVLAVLIGMFFGSRLGTRFGRPARILGGIILIALGIRLLFP